MAGIRLQFNRAAVKDLLTGNEVKADLERRIAGIEQACKSESSWGGYFHATTLSGDRYSARLWSISTNLPGAHDRHQRMVRNMDAGS